MDGLHAFVVLYLYFVIDEDVFLLITPDNVESTSLDLRKYDSIFKIDFNNMRTDGINKEQFFSFMDYMGFEYVNTLLIKEKKYDEIYYIDNAKSLDELNNTTIEESNPDYSKSIIFHGISFDFGLGGSHACCKPGVYESDNDMIIVDYDVSSLYPSG